MDERYEDIVDRCIQQVLAGASPDAVADAYPEHRAELLDMLRPLALFVAAPVEPPAPAARTAALHRMLARVSAASSPAPRGFLFGAFSSFSARPVALRLASGVAAIVLFAGAGIVAAAVTGHGPGGLPGGSGNGAAGTWVQGTVVSRSSDDSLWLISKGIQFEVRLNPQIDGAPVIAPEFKPGDVIQVHGKRGSDHVFHADKVKIEPPRKDSGVSVNGTPGSHGNGSGNGSANGSGEGEGAHQKTETPESAGSPVGSGGDGSTDTDHGDEATPRPTAPTSTSSGHGSPSSTPTATERSDGGGETGTPHSDDTPETKTPELGD
jgi:hypothetical protein